LNSLTARLLVFNILLVFIPAVALILLDTYEKQLLVQQEKAMVQQGRIFSSALTEGDLAGRAESLLNGLNGRLEARIRVVNDAGLLLVDSAIYGKEQMVKEPLSKIYRSEGIPNPTPREIQKTILYRVAVTPIRLLRKYVLPPAPPYSSGEFYSGKKILSGPEITAALNGRYGAVTRISIGGQKSVNLYCAIPVFDPEGKVRGAVLVTQSTYKILDNLYRIRLDIIRIFIFYLLGSAAFSLVMARTIAAPLKKLRDQAERFLDAHGKPSGSIIPMSRSDEIGDLSRSLNQMTRRLEERIRFTEDFFSDILHEVKNPLTAIRSSAELAETAQTQRETTRFLGMIQQETEKLEKLLSSLREISRIHTGLLQEKEEIFDMGKLLSDLSEAYQYRTGNQYRFSLVPQEGPLPFSGNRDRMAQVLANLFENAVSFTPERGEIRATVRSDGHGLHIEIEDSGPGIPPDDKEKIFNRFYTTRGQGEGHQGLGLSIVKSIIEGYGGSITADNRSTGGAVFTIRLPAVIL
jgi:two-component system sensor histidine kinase ChvG